MNLTAIDFEASCLPRHGRSFPIEVGIADERGARAWLIRPRPEWQGWDWTARAERLHGIDRATLERSGLPAVQVAAEVAAAVQGRRLIADSRLDGTWLALLMEASGSASPPVAHVSDIMTELGTTEAEIDEACSALSGHPFRRHRAAEDARWLHGLLTRLRGMAASRMEATPKPPLFGWNAPSAQPAAGVWAHG
jgi:hypothetical protein